MAYKLIWSPAARDDLHDIVVFIGRDNPERAMSFGYELKTYPKAEEWRPILPSPRAQSVRAFQRVVGTLQHRPAGHSRA
jgi:hypothetical protein